MKYRDIARAARKQGWREQPVKKGSNWLSPDGKTIVNWHGTPSDVRAVRNFLARMKRGGLRWPP